MPDNEVKLATVEIEFRDRVYVCLNGAAISYHETVETAQEAADKINAAASLLVKGVERKAQAEAFQRVAKELRERGRAAGYSLASHVGGWMISEAEKWERLAMDLRALAPKGE